MSEKHSDIRDDEIRIISSGGPQPRPRRKSRAIIILLIVLALILVICGALWYVNASPSEDEDVDLNEMTSAVNPAETTVRSTDLPAPAYTECIDTVVNGIGLQIYTPHNATPVLEIGRLPMGDTVAVLVVQAADVRGDNGRIAGTYVVRGELVSKGEAKAGFCSIINGEITIGVADATPMLEQALSTDGYFFRQYPLVVGGQIVENKPKGRAYRKALAEIDGRYSVVFSTERLTFHDFSQVLIDAGARNAIYLVGGDSNGFCINAEGNRIDFATYVFSPYENVNYIVWR